MKEISKQFASLHIIVLLIIGSSFASAQSMSFRKAYGLMNGGSVWSGSGNSSGSSIGTGIVNGYTNKNTISYGIPENIYWEYYNLRNGLTSFLISYPNIENISTADVRQAMASILEDRFVKISEYAQVNVKLNFRFFPPQMSIYGTDGYPQDYLYTSTSTPNEPGIFYMPNTPVSGSKIMVIKK